MSASVMRVLLATLLLPALLLVALPPVANAAPEVPQGVQAGDAARASEAWETAETAYREALEESPRCWQAQEGLARVMAALERKPEALAALRRAVLDADRAGSIQPKDHVRLAEARLLLVRQDPLTRELQKIMAAASKGLVRFAASKKKKAPAVAEAALRRVLRFDPLCADAHAALAKQRALPFGVWVAQFHGSFDDWGRVNSSEWKVLDKDSFELDGRKSAFGTSTDRKFTGDFDMRAEMRVVDTGGEAWVACMRGGVVGEYDRVAFGIGQGQLFLDFSRGDESPGEPFYNMPVDRLDPPIDPKEFNTYELQFRGDKVTALVNGRVIISARRAFHRHRGGLGVQTQLARAVYRKLEVRQR